MRGKNPTRAQKIELQEKYRLNPDNWMVQKNTAELLQVVHRHTGKVKKLMRELSL